MDLPHPSNKAPGTTSQALRRGKLSSLLKKMKTSKAVQFVTTSPHLSWRVHGLAKTSPVLHLAGAEVMAGV